MENCKYRGPKLVDGTHECIFTDICERQECNYKFFKKHPIRKFFFNLSYFFNFKNKWYAIKLEWNYYRSGVDSFTEFLQQAWRELWAMER